MPSQPSTPAARRRAAATAWCVACLLALALVAGLGLAGSGSAAAAAAPKGPIAVPFFEDGGEEECEVGEPDCAEIFVGEECESSAGAEDEEAEECEEVEADEGEAPAECLLTSARPQVTVSGAQRRLRLTVRYTLDAPAEVAVSLRGSGDRGGLTIAAEKRRLNRSGSFQETTGLSPAETERALAAGEFTVRLRAIGVPWSCHRYDFRHLAVKRQGHGGTVFSERTADLRAGH